MATGYWQRGIGRWQKMMLLCGVCLSLVACGGSGGSASAPAVAIAPPAIAAQPANQSVPMGLTATFAVVAGGASVQYQWFRDGAAIAGANSSSLTTPPTTFADAGASYSVSVSNSAGSVESSEASLTVTARAPAAGDWRFQQVDAPYIVNGWGNAGVGLATAVPGRSAFTYSPSVGTPFYVGSEADCSVPPVTNGMGCDWFYSVWPVLSSAAPLAGYAADFYEDFAADLQSGSPILVPSENGVGPSSSDAVITSLDLEPASDLFAVSWIQTPPANGAAAQANGFVMVQNTVASAQLQAAATAEGAAGRVITAISANEPGEVTYLAYAWQADPTTLYDLKVVTASTAGAPAAAGTLAAQGYIITATGQADGTGDLFLVGTRVQGDTTPRPFEAVQGSSEFQAMQQQGYAVVGVIQDLTQADEYIWLAER
ncbi:MAG: hypothetical protein ACREV7_03305 [Steroidobacteraceae bacterium]